MADEKELEIRHCGECGVMFGMTPFLYQKRLEDHQTFFCPNGHPRQFAKPKTDPKDEELTKLRAELKEATDKVSRLQKEVDELKLDLEIWKPATVVDHSTVMTENKGS